MVSRQHPVTVCFFFLLVLLRGRLTDMGAGTPFPAAVIADPKIICQPDGGFPAWQSKQPGHKINHIAVRPAPETVEAAVYLHAGGSVGMERTADHAVSAYPDSIQLRRLSCGHILLDGFKYIHHIILSGNEKST